MKISDLCIKRRFRHRAVPGGDAGRHRFHLRLPVREYPKIDEPVVTVDTTYRGASAEIIESQVTKPWRIRSPASRGWR